MTTSERAERIERIRNLPALMAELTQSLSREQLLARPLEGEWSVAQNVHHVADSHMNAYMRTRLMLTEDHPTIRPYDQERWAELADAHTAEIAMSLELLAGLHKRWVALFESLPEAAYGRTGWHPENRREITIESILADYADHGEAHLEQIQRTLSAQSGLQKSI